MRYLFLLMLCILTLAPLDSSAQRDRQQDPKKTQQDTVEKQAARRAKVKKDLEDNRDRHTSIQDRKTKRRMKKTRKKSQHLAQNKPQPFYKRWFRKKGFK